jgi:hypothetical protein
MTDFGSVGCRFEPCRGHNYLLFIGVKKIFAKHLLNILIVNSNEKPFSVMKEKGAMLRQMSSI